MDFEQMTMLRFGLVWVSLALLGFFDIVICGNALRHCFWHHACVVTRMFLVGIFDVFLGVCGKYHKLIDYFVFTQKKKKNPISMEK
jgi:hypothetical protein